MGSNPNKIDRFYSDLTFSLKCLEWPEVSDWSERPNKQWPTLEEIERIKSYGCHFVPQSQNKCENHKKDADTEGLTWRISFSKAEVELSKLVPTAARMCYVALKIIAKDYLFVVCKKLKSYHLKCIFFYTLENSDKDVWMEDNLEYCFKLLLTNLGDSFRNQLCSLFWVSTYDMFGDLDESDFNGRYFRQVENIEENPSRFIEPFRNREALEVV